MNVSYPPFSAVSSSQSTVSTARSNSSPAGVVIVTPSGRSTTISSLSKNCTRRVCARKAGTAEATNCSPSPRPTISGHSRRAPTSVSGSSRLIATNA